MDNAKAAALFNSKHFINRSEIDNYKILESKYKTLKLPIIIQV
jgi:uncharacterized protein (UPF0216 family)